jgi:hypothetical protein
MKINCVANEKGLDNTMAKRKRTKGQTMIYKTLQMFNVVVSEIINFYLSSAYPNSRNTS